MMDVFAAEELSNVLAVGSKLHCLSDRNEWLPTHFNIHSEESSLDAGHFWAAEQAFHHDWDADVFA